MEDARSSLNDVGRSLYYSKNMSEALNMSLYFHQLVAIETEQISAIKAQKGLERATKVM